jgi:serine/threonine protein kinase/CheY-like chemotaxis protein
MSTILVIEDDVLIRENIIGLLVAEGFSAVSAADGRKGLASAVTLLPDIIVCDVTMPEMDGWTVLKEIRKDPRTARIPFIFMTGNADRQDMRTGMNLGADDYITKPFTTSDLLDCIHSRLRRSAPHSGERDGETEIAIAMESIQPGQLFDRYRIEEAVGEGGMGFVYRAHDTKLDRLVALKILKPEVGDDVDAREKAAARLLAEARAAAKLNDRHVVSIYDVGTFGKLPFLAMEFITGQTLRRSVGAPWKQKIRWLRDVALALSAAHRANIVHRDIKPDNVMVREDGRAIVLDFGIARRSAESTLLSLSTAISVVGLVRGTVPYMAPEQITGGEIDGRSDQFSWGVMAYELLSGTLPWGEADKPLQMVAAILYSQPRPLVSVAACVPEDVAGVIARAMAKEPAARFVSMDELLQRMKACGGGLLFSEDDPASQDLSPRPVATDERASSSEELVSPPAGSADPPRTPISDARALATTEAVSVTPPKDTVFDTLACAGALPGGQERQAPGLLGMKATSGRTSAQWVIVAFVVVGVGVAWFLFAR